MTFTPGQTSKTLTVPIIGDTTVEPDETFVVNLTSPTNATLADAIGQGTIQNDDVAATTIQFSKPSFTSTEGGNTTTVTISRSGTLANSSTVQFYISNGTAIAGQDFTDSSLTNVTFAADEKSKTVSISPIDDLLAEPTEFAFLRLINPTNGTLGGQDVALWNIEDNDSSTIVAGTTNLMSQSSDPLLASYEPFNVLDNMATSANFFV
ncbi:Calx-beta domain-containing protein [Aphanothece hegewaldii]|uniref:Calx-beta domain-containing protein n=1 Tax=Aphanothece hegewaldii TaxID=1521625 RepID=UPI001C63AFF6|nr:Calx-beta domain-containing protein [Aphanothece hegewaldii]